VNLIQHSTFIIPLAVFNQRLIACYFPRLKYLIFYLMILNLNNVIYFFLLAKILQNCWRVKFIRVPSLIQNHFQSLVFTFTITLNNMVFLVTLFIRSQ
jgi:hypothetical protein